MYEQRRQLNNIVGKNKNACIKANPIVQHFTLKTVRHTHALEKKPFPSFDVETFMKMNKRTFLAFGCEGKSLTRKKRRSVLCCYVSPVSAWWVDCLISQLNLTATLEIAESRPVNLVKVPLAHIALAHEVAESVQAGSVHLVKVALGEGAEPGRVNLIECTLGEGAESGRVDLVEGPLGELPETRRINLIKATFWHFSRHRLERARLHPRRVLVENVVVVETSSQPKSIKF